MDSILEIGPVGKSDVTGRTILAHKIRCACSPAGLLQVKYTVRKQLPKFSTWLIPSA